MAQAGMSLMSSGLLGGVGAEAAGATAGAGAGTAGNGVQFAPLAPPRRDDALGGLMTV